MMPPEATSTTTTATENDRGRQVAAIAKSLCHLSNGDLAMLRRGPLHKAEAGAPAFWMLSAWHGFPANEQWATIVQAMALLTRRSDSGKGHENPHDPDIPLGRALCDGNDPAWPGPGTNDPRPMLSELRFARLLNSHGASRRDLLLRAVRMLARADTPVNCKDIADLVLAGPGNEIPTRRLARDYYSRLTKVWPPQAGQQADNT